MAGKDDRRLAIVTSHRQRYIISYHTRVIYVTPIRLGTRPLRSYTQINYSLQPKSVGFTPLHAAILIGIVSYLEMIQNIVIYNNMWNYSHGPGTSRIKERH